MKPFAWILTISLILTSWRGSATIYGNELYDIESLWLTQHFHVSAEHLCQDGKYIFFKSLADCTQATGYELCPTDLLITPINYMEKVELPSGASVTRFFSVPTEFKVYRYEIVEEEPIVKFKMVETINEELPYCEGMKKQKYEKVSRKRKAKPEEVSFLQGLVESGVSLVNSPYGPFVPEKFDEELLINEDNKRPILRSPQCNSKADYKDMVHKASGEWNGNGIVQISELKSWQVESIDLFMVKTKSHSTTESNYKFFCLNEGDDV